MTAEYLLNLLMALAAGGIVGFVNEYRKIIGSKIFLGLRTSMFISLLGYTFSLLSTIFPKSLVVISSTVAIVVISTSIYLEKTRITNNPGATTYVSMFLVFFAGFFEGLGMFDIGIIIAVLVASLGIYKIQLLNALSKIQKKELLAMVNLMIFSLAILPFLPNRPIGPYGLINPFQFWVIVVVIGTIFLVQYVILKYYRKGLVLFSIVGGIISSTIVTLSLLELSRKRSGIGKQIALNIMFSNITLISIQVMLFTYIVTKSLKVIYGIALPCVITLSILVVLLLIEKKELDLINIEQPRTPFPIKSILSFALMLFFIMLGSKIVNIMAPNFLPLAIFASGFANVASTIISIGLLYTNSEIGASIASNLILISLLSALLEKGLLSFLSKDRQTRKYALSISLLLVAVVALFIYRPIF
ncbi:MAG: DUF4010 domain-containing protein [Caldisphaeraceae archaeon]|nr:DUF4010 domain-containing protein [Caldisphaeraceae archaeon]